MRGTMKKLTIGLCFFLAVTAVQARGIRDEMDLASEKARVSYAFGMMVGEDLQQAGLEIDYAEFTEGLRATMEQANTRITREEALELIQETFESAMNRQTTELRGKEMEFLTENADRSGMITTASGLQYMVLQEGSGPKPVASDTVTVHYEGALIDGRGFDSSYEEDQPVEIPLEMVIPGWSEALQLMDVGSKCQFYIPSWLAYGERGVGQIIPPHATLVFTIELIGIVEGQNEEEE